MIKVKSDFKYILIESFLPLLLISFFVFFVTERNVQSWVIGLFLRKAIIYSLVAAIVQWVIGERIISAKYIEGWSIVAIWLGYVLFKRFALDNELGSTEYDFEICIAIYSGIFFVLVTFLSERFNPLRIVSIVNCIAKFTLVLVPTVSLVHYFIYGTGIVYEEMMAVYHTSPREAWEWFATYIGISNGLVILVFLGGLLKLLGVIRKNSIGKSSYASNPINNLRAVGIAVMALGVAVYPCQILSRTEWTGYYIRAAKYAHNINRYGGLMEKRYSDIAFDTKQMILDKPHTIVLLIGESACRDRLKAYNDKVEYDNTPWLSRQKADEDFIFFDNWYGCQSVTLQVLECYLTERSYYNGKEMLNSMNIIDVAKKRGYKTYWITNSSVEDSGYSVIAGRANKVLREPAPYDDNMLKYLQEVNPNDNNLIVLHGNGSHAAYTSRYPHSAEHFNDGSREAQYANAVLFVDKFMENAFNYCKERLNMHMFIYASDHGENLITGHGPSDRDFAKVRIPAFVYISKEYQNRHSDIVDTLRHNKAKYFTNDMMYNTMCGIIGAKSQYYDEKEDLSSVDFAYNLDDLYTFAKKSKVAEDPTLALNR